MENEIRIVARKSDGKCQWDGLFTRKTAETARAFHRTIPGYVPTPLVDLKGLAARLGLASFHVKDESFRFSLNAFKGLGGQLPHCPFPLHQHRRGYGPDPGRQILWERNWARS